MSVRATSIFARCNVATAEIGQHSFNIGDLICTRGLHRDVDPEWPVEIVATTPTTISFPYTHCNGPVDFPSEVEVVLVETVWRKMLEETEQKRREIRQNLAEIEGSRPDAMIESLADWIAEGATLLDYVEEKANGLDVLRALVLELEERGDIPSGHVLVLPSSGTIIEVDDLSVTRDFEMIERVDGDNYGFRLGDVVETGRGEFTARIDPNEHLDVARLVDASFRAGRIVTIRDRRSPMMVFRVQITEARLVSIGSQHEQMSFEIRGFVMEWPEQQRNAVVYSPEERVLHRGALDAPSPDGVSFEVNFTMETSPIVDAFRETARFASALREQDRSERRLMSAIDRREIDED